jgi:signal transduction histidine kinase
LALYGSQGQAALQAITQQGARFADRDMYVFVFDRQGQYRAFAGKPEKVGTNVRAVQGVDGDKLVRDAFERAAHGGGWVDYEFANPQTGATDLKTSYVEAISADMVMGCGVYKQTDKQHKVAEGLQAGAIRSEQREVLGLTRIKSTGRSRPTGAAWQQA